MCFNGTGIWGGGTINHREQCVFFQFRVLCYGSTAIKNFTFLSVHFILKYTRQILTSKVGPRTKRVQQQK